MNIILAERSATERELDIEIPAESLTSLVEGKLEEYRKKIRLQGFRPGKIPRDVVRKRFGASIRAEALEELVDNTLRKAFREKSLEPVAPGRIETLDAPEAGPIKFKAVVEVEPVIELRNYDSLGISIESSAVSDQEFNERLEQIRQQLAEVTKPERPSQTGDLVTARYLRILVEGEEMPAPVPVFQAELGKGIPEVDKGLTGTVVGQQVTIPFQFPADYADANQAGKKAVYEVTVEGVYERVLPEFTDEFVAKIGPFATVADFHARVRTDLEENSKQQARQKAHDEAVEVVLSRNPFAVPKARVEAYLQWQHQRLSRQGTELPPVEQMAASFGPAAEQALRRQRAIEWIAEKETIKVTTEEVDARIRLLAEQAGISPADAREELRKTGKLVEIRESLRFEKTLDWLVGVR